MCLHVRQGGFKCASFHTLFCICVHVCVVYIPDLLPSLVPTALLALWWDFNHSQSNLHTALKAATREGGVVVLLIPVPCSSAKNVLFWPVFDLKVSTSEDCVKFSQFTVLTCVSNLLVFVATDQRSVWPLICWLFRCNPYVRGLFKCVVFLHGSRIRFAMLMEGFKRGEGGKTWTFFLLNLANSFCHYLLTSVEKILICCLHFSLSLFPSLFV